MEERNKTKRERRELKRKEKNMYIIIFTCRAPRAAEDGAAGGAVAAGVAPDVAAGGGTETGVTSASPPSGRSDLDTPLPMLTSRQRRSSDVTDR